MKRTVIVVSLLMLSVLIPTVHGQRTSAASVGATAGRWTIQATVPNRGEEIWVSCADVDVCDATAGATVLQTVNAGITWRSHPVAHHDDIFAISCSGIFYCDGIGDAASHDDQYFERETARSTWIRASGVVTDIEPTGMEAISCVAKTKCVAVGYATLSGGNANGYPIWTLPAFTTNDGRGGDVWSKSMIPFRPGSITGGLTSVDCPSTTTCYAVSWFYQDGAAVVRSNNGGRTWRIEPITNGTTISTKSLKAVRFRQISCPTEQVCTIVATAAKRALLLLHTDNGGASWHWSAVPTVDEPANSINPAISCASVSVCEVLDGRTFLRSTDGEEKWTRQVVPKGFGEGVSVSCVVTTRCVATAIKVVERKGASLHYGASQMLLLRVPKK